MKKVISSCLLFLHLLSPFSLKAFEIPFSTGFYVSATGSCNIISGQKKHHSRPQFEPGFLVNATLGSYLGCHFRLEGEFAYRNNQARDCIFDVANLDINVKMHGKSESYAGMANLYYDIPIFFIIKPYVGVGVGYAYVKNHLDFHYPALSISQEKKNDSSFAWQAIAGVSYPMWTKWTLSFDYRYFQPTQLKRLQTHTVGINLRYDL